MGLPTIFRISPSIKGAFNHLVTSFTTLDSSKVSGLPSLGKSIKSALKKGVEALEKNPEKAIELFFNASMTSFEKSIRKGYGSVNQTLMSNVAEVAYLKAKFTEQFLVETADKAKRNFFFKQMYGNWLNTEKVLIARNSLMARKWEQIQKTKHIFPNLEYVPSRSANPRHSHKALYGVVKPIDDPFWSTYMPTNGYNCKCSVRASRKDVSTESPTLEIDNEFKQNTGITGKIFTKDYPYYKNAPKAFLNGLKTISESLLKNYLATKESDA